MCESRTNPKLLSLRCVSIIEGSTAQLESRVVCLEVCLTSFFSLELHGLKFRNDILRTHILITSTSPSQRQIQKTSNSQHFSLPIFVFGSEPNKNTGVWVRGGPNLTRQHGAMVSDPTSHVSEAHHLPTWPRNVGSGWQKISIFSGVLPSELTHILGRGKTSKVHFKGNMLVPTRKV